MPVSILNNTLISIPIIGHACIEVLLWSLYQHIETVQAGHNLNKDIALKGLLCLEVFAAPLTEVLTVLKVPPKPVSDKGN